MARIFADTCGLVKIYRMETNSPQVRACFANTDLIVIAQASLLEFPSAFYGMIRQQRIAPEEAASYIDAFRTDLPQYEIISSDTTVYSDAERLLDYYAVTHNLRPMDSLQFATALVTHRQSPLGSFVTTDSALADVARAEGLTVRP